MNYSMHRLTTSMAYVTTLTYASTNDQWAGPARLLVSSSKTNRVLFDGLSMKSYAQSLIFNLRVDNFWRGGRIMRCSISIISHVIVEHNYTINRGGGFDSQLRGYYLNGWLSSDR